MKSELEKCLSGELYNCHDEYFIKGKARASELCRLYNATPYSDRAGRRKLLEEMFASIGDNVTVGDGFTCGFGTNISIGSNVSINMNCTFIDCNKIVIGNDTLIASGVHLTTAAHPVELSERLTPNWDPASGEYRWRTYAKPITIGNGCWIGANVVILPGVTIGDGAVIGAGSVVTKDIPPNVVAVGSPCRVLREINKK